MGPPVEQVRRALTAAGRAVSVHIAVLSLMVAIVAVRAFGLGNGELRYAEHLQAALAAAGVATDVRRLPDPEYAGLLAVVRPRDGDPDKDAAALAAAIEERRTPVHGAVRRSFPPDRLATPPPGGPDLGADAFAVLATPGDDVIDWLRAGEATSAVLLDATRMGLASTPLSQAVEVEPTRRAIGHTLPDIHHRPRLILRFGRLAEGSTEVEQRVAGVSFLEAPS